jgi:hypothetical protein
MPGIVDRLPAAEDAAMLADDTPILTLRTTFRETRSSRQIALIVLS